MKNMENMKKFKLNTNPEDATHYYNFILPQIPFCPSDCLSNPNYNDEFLQAYFSQFAAQFKLFLLNSLYYYDIEWNRREGVSM